jgi:hypothetical protein
MGINGVRNQDKWGQESFMLKVKGKKRIPLKALKGHNTLAQGEAL